MVVEPAVAAAVVEVPEVNQEQSSRIKIITPTPSRSNSFRNKPINFRTFHSSTRRGGYTVNGPNLHPETMHESVPMTTGNCDVEAPQMDEDYFPPPPPEDLYEAESSPVQVLAVNSFDEELNIPPPASPSYDSDVQPLRTSNPLR